MPATPPHQLRLTIAPDSLALPAPPSWDLPLPWIGRSAPKPPHALVWAWSSPILQPVRAGRGRQGRTSLLHQAMQQAAAQRSVPLTFATCTTSMPPERPRALRLPAGQGRCCARAWRSPRARYRPTYLRLDGADFRRERAHRKAYESQESQAFCRPDAFAEALQFRLSRRERAWSSR